MKRTRIYARSSARSRAGYTLFELMASMASASIILGGLSSSIYIASRGLDQDGTAQRADADQILDKLVADVEHARSFSERTANAVTFTVPDRDGDSLPDTIRYAWSGTPGDPLTYEYNGSAAETIAEDVYNFNLASMTRFMAAPVIPPSDGGNLLLFVVADPTSLDTKEAGRRDLMEGWGYSVTLIDDADTQANFDEAAADNHVIYVSGTINGGSLLDKLTGSTTAIVNESPGKLDNFGFCSSTTQTVSTSEFSSSDVAHYISSPFNGGAITTFTSPLSMPVPSSTVAPGLRNVAEVTGTPALVTLDFDAERYDSAPAPARRVHLPFASAETTQLTADGRTLMQRSIEWAAGAGEMGPIAHWKLDDASGFTAIDTVGGHHGTLTNGPSWDTGPLDGALSFDGSNDYVSVPHDDNLSLTTLSLSAWIRPTSLSGWRIVVSKGNTTSWNYYLGTNGSEVAFGFNNSGSWTEFVTTGASLSTDQWYHLAGTFDDAAGEGKIYLNGALIHTGSTTASPPTTSDAVTIGTSPAGEYWSGILDDIRIYNGVLSESAIAELTDGGEPPTSGVVFGDFTEGRRVIDSNTGVTIPKPIGTAPGDLLIVAVATDGDTVSTLSPSASWNLTQLDVGHDGGGNVTLGVWWKIADGTEGSDVTVQWTGGEQAYGWIMRFTGHDPSSPIATAAMSTGNDTNPLSTNLITSTDGMLILRVGGFDDDDITVDAPGLPGHTVITMDRSNSGNQNTVSGGAGYILQPTAGDTGTSNFNLTAREQYRTITIGIRPDPN